MGPPVSPQLVDQVNWPREALSGVNRSPTLSDQEDPTVGTIRPSPLDAAQPAGSRRVDWPWSTAGPHRFRGNDQFAVLAGVERHRGIQLSTRRRCRQRYPSSSTTSAVVPRGGGVPVVGRAQPGSTTDVRGYRPAGERQSVSALLQRHFGVLGSRRDPPCPTRNGEGLRVPRVPGQIMEVGVGAQGRRRESIDRAPRNAVVERTISTRKWAGRPPGYRYRPSVCTSDFPRSRPIPWAGNPSPQKSHVVGLSSSSRKFGMASNNSSSAIRTTADA